MQVTRRLITLLTLIAMVSAVMLGAAAVTGAQEIIEEEAPSVEPAPVGGEGVLPRDEDPEIAPAEEVPPEEDIVIAPLIAPNPEGTVGLEEERGGLSTLAIAALALTGLALLGGLGGIAWHTRRHYGVPGGPRPVAH